MPTSAPPAALLFPSVGDLRRDLALPAKVGVSLLELRTLDLDRHPGLRLPAPLSSSVDKRRREYLGGRICARAALRQAGDTQSDYPAFGADRLPCWPEGWLGSISHSGGLAAALAAPVAACMVLGLDVQHRSELNSLDGVQALVALPDELELLAGHDPLTRLLLLFSAKEALYKALYPQVREFQDFSAARLAGVGAEQLELELAQDWSPRWTAGIRLPVRYAVYADYIATAVCVAGDAALADA